MSSAQTRDNVRHAVVMQHSATLIWQYWRGGGIKWLALLRFYCLDNILLSNATGVEVGYWIPCCERLSSSILQTHMETTSAFLSL